MCLLYIPLTPEKPTKPTWSHLMATTHWEHDTHISLLLRGEMFELQSSINYQKIITHTGTTVFDNPVWYWFEFCFPELWVQFESSSMTSWEGKITDIQWLRGKNRNPYPGSSVQYNRPIMRISLVVQWVRKTSWIFSMSVYMTCSNVGSEFNVKENELSR